MHEQNLIYVVVAGIALCLVSFLWAIGRAFSKGAWWGVLALIPPFLLLWMFSGPPRTDGRRRGGRGPAVLFLIGATLAVGTWVANKVVATYVSFGERERVIDGRRHITITGWDKDDYSLLAQRPDAAVLLMANKDVTNETLKHLEGMAELEVLDVSDSKVDDDGLAAIARLPKLRELFLSRTAVTDEGFRTHLAAVPTLHKVTVTKTGVKAKSLRDWKNADAENRSYVGP